MSKWKKEIERKIDHLAFDLLSKVEITECEKCGTLIYRKDGNKGKPEIRHRVPSAMGIINYIESGSYAPKLDDYIYYPYYCKKCMPKEKSCKGSGKK